jgi:hypothetical protein
VPWPARRSQHVFVDPSRPRSDYSLAYNCVACPDNQRTLNDGYHIVHHLNSQVGGWGCAWLRECPLVGGWVGGWVCRPFWVWVRGWVGL